MDDTTIFEIIRYAVPVAWSDWAIDRLVRRLSPREDDDPPPRMSRGLTVDERRLQHGLAPRPPRERLTKTDGLCKDR